MVTIAIVAILTAIAYPSYMSYVMRANRTDATTGLQEAAQGLQRCYSQSTTFSYVGCAVPASSPNGYYTITETNVTAPKSTALSTFLLTATPAKAPQTKDTQCGSFTLNNIGTQTAATSTGTVNTTTCWPGN
jgi:type IV pilus assembly protein PilE